MVHRIEQFTAKMLRKVFYRKATIIRSWKLLKFLSEATVLLTFIESVNNEKSNSLAPSVSSFRVKRNVFEKEVFEERTSVGFQGRKLHYPVKI